MQPLGMPTKANIPWRLLEKIAARLPTGEPFNRAGDQRSDGDDGQARPRFQGNGICNQESVYGIVAQFLARAGQQQTVRGHDVDFRTSTGFKQSGDASRDRSAGGDHIVNDNAWLITDLAHNAQHASFSAALALFVNDGYGGAELLGVKTGHFYPAHRARPPLRRRPAIGCAAHPRAPEPH